MTDLISFASPTEKKKVTTDAFASKFTMVHMPQLADLETSGDRWKDVVLALSNELSVSEWQVASLSAELEAKDRMLAEYRTLEEAKKLSRAEPHLARTHGDEEAEAPSTAIQQDEEAAKFFKTFTELYANAEKEFELRTNERGEVAIVARDIVFEVVYKRGETAFWFTRDLSRRLSLPAVAMATFTPLMASSVSAPPTGPFVSLSGSDWLPLFSVSFKQSHWREYTGWRPL